MVTVQTDQAVHQGQPRSEAAAARALIEEARRRRRWFLRGVPVLAGTLAIAIGLAASLSGSGPSPSHHSGETLAGPVPVGAHETMVKGTFVGDAVVSVKLSGKIRFVTDHGHKTYTTKATDGRWKTKLPPGAYAVEGLSNQVTGGRRWSQPTHLVVRVGRSQSNVSVYDSLF